MIPAHGGRLINRMAPAAQRDALLAQVEGAKRIPLNARESADFEMIEAGARIPLTLDCVRNP